MGSADKNFWIVYHCWRGQPVAALEEYLLGADAFVVVLARRCSHRARSCLPVAVGRPAEGGVASLRPWQIAIYEQWASIVKKKHVTFALFASSTSPSFSLPSAAFHPFDPPFCSSSTLSNSGVLFSSSSSGRLSSISAFSISETKIPLLRPTPIERSFLPIISQNGKVTEWDCFPSRVVRLYRFLRWLLAVSSTVKRWFCWFSSPAFPLRMAEWAWKCFKCSKFGAIVITTLLCKINAVRESPEQNRISFGSFAVG